MTKPADLLFVNALVLTMDDEMHQYEPGAVAVGKDSILAVGPEAQIKQSYDAAQVVDCGGKVLMPGLINAHTHVPMTLLRGLADDLRLDVWLMGYMMPVEREFVSPDFVRLGTQLACAELIHSGVTCFADMYYFEEDIAKATAEIGLRAVCSQTVMKFPTPDAGSYEDSMIAGARFHRALEGTCHHRAFGGAACALYLHARDPAGYGQTGGRVRCAPAHASLRDGPGSGKYAPG